ncbi:hypothetical protein MTO96_046249, partial [Rhipicephalus appendiculatus]
VLKRFFDNKRRTYRLERKKVDHTKSDQPASDVYVGRWKFYKALKFLDGAKVRVRRSIMGQAQQQIAERDMPPMFTEDIDTLEPAAVDEAPTVVESATVDEEGCTTECVPIGNLSAPSTPNQIQSSSKKRRRNNQSPPQEEMWTERQKVLEKIAMFTSKCADCRCHGTAPMSLKKEHILSRTAARIAVTLLGLLRRINLAH